MCTQPVYILVNLTSFESNKLVAMCNQLISELISSIHHGFSFCDLTFGFEVFQIEGEHIIRLDKFADSNTLSEDDMLQLSIKKTLGIRNAQLAFDLLHNSVKESFINKEFGSHIFKPLVFYISDTKISKPINDIIKLFPYPELETECLTADEVIIGTNIRPIYIDYQINQDAVSTFLVEDVLTITQSIKHIHRDIDWIDEKDLLQPPTGIEIIL